MSPTNKDIRILTAIEVAKMLRVHPSTVSRLAQKGSLKSHVIGKRRLFKESDVLSFFENQVAWEYAFGKESRNVNSGDPKTKA